MAGNEVPFSDSLKTQGNMQQTLPLQNATKADVSDKQTLLAVLQFLKKNNLKGTEELLKREASIKDDDVRPPTSSQSETDVSHALAAYKSADDPSRFADYYTNLKTFIESCLDAHKVELSVILYPVFIHMYLEMVYNEHESYAISFFRRFSKEQEDFYQEDLQRLATVTKKEHMKGNELMESFKASKFVIKMSRDSYNHLKRYLQENKMKPLLTIIQEHLFIDVFDGVPRTKQQIDATSGGLMGESERDANKVKVFYGLLKEPDINMPLEEEDEAPEGDDKPKKKKPKKDPLMMKKSKNDPHAPAFNRIPLPEMKDQDKMEKITAYREALKRVKVNRENLPTICFYTVLNSYQGVTSIDMAEDSSLLSVGFADSTIRVFTTSSQKLRGMKTAGELDSIDRDADDVLERMMDDRTAADSKLLTGHSGPVYAARFSRDRKYLVSCSEDGTVRLWSLLTWTNLVCYKGHNHPVWDVEFSPYGHYFVSVGHDRTARLWATDHHVPIRIFSGHLSDMDCVKFHPNSNYIATGSNDRFIRLWDILNGNCVRIFSGHKGSVQTLCFSPDGRFLASSGVDSIVLLWDISTGGLMAQMKGHTDTVYSLCFSRDGGVLASGGLDNSVKLWDVVKVLQEVDTDADTSIPSSVHVNDSAGLLIGSWATKATPVLCIHFTRKNLMIASGPAALQEDKSPHKT
ncbi:transcription initiation factor TFIID subunit 5-like [Crassostrea virginica]